MRAIKLPAGVYEFDPTKPLGKRGGFGQVFAGQTADHKELAIKKLHVSAAEAAHRELQIAAELKDRAFEHVIGFIDAGEDADSGEYFVVMPRAESSLQSYLDANGTIATPDVAGILLQITKGLLEVGELVHRDLKPDNILLHDRRWKIADFGIARFVEAATASKTLKDCLSPYYAAPEQWRFERATHATDVYALGCIGFCLLTGKSPFVREPEQQHQKEPVPKFQCTDSRLQALINMMLRKEPATRPSLSRVHVLLADIASKPQLTSATDPNSELARAGALVADREQRAQAERLAQETAHRARMELARGASQILTENIERLWEKIHMQAPNARRESDRRMHSIKIRLGEAHLEANPLQTTYIPPGAFKHSGWDVIAGSKIAVMQHSREYIWSSSLWYAKLKGASEYRWYETSYWTLGRSTYEPFSCEDLEDADYAASNVMHTVNIAFGPEEIDDEEEDEFHKRWTWLLAKASVGELRQPSGLPIRNWPPHL